MVATGDVFGGIWLALIGFVINGSALGGLGPDRAHDPHRPVSSSPT